MKKVTQFVLTTTSDKKKRVIASGSSRMVRIRSPKQLFLPFPDPAAAFFVDVPCFSYTEILESLSSTKPKWVFDVRKFPRLDVIAGSRATAFRYFKRYHSIYVDLFGRFEPKPNAPTTDSNWLNVLLDVINESEKRSGPYLFLMDDAEVIEIGVSKIPPILQRFAGHRIGTALLSTR